MKIKVLSLNIEHGGVLMDALLPFLRETAADVLLLQEVHSGVQGLPPNLRTVQYFSEQLDYPFSCFMPLYRNFDHTPDGSSFSGLATLSRFPIVDVGQHYFDFPYTESYRDSFEMAKFHPAALLTTVLQIEGQAWLAGNVHGPWHLNGEEFIERRGMMVDAIIQQTQGHNRVVVAGDTNAKPHNPAFGRLTHLNSVFGQELRSTFNMKRKTLPGYAEAAVDAMWVSPDVRVVWKDCPQVEVSDHLPLLAELEA